MVAHLVAFACTALLGHGDKVLSTGKGKAASVSVVRPNRAVIITVARVTGVSTF